VSAPARTPRDELAESTEVGGVYLRRLVRAQLSLSLLTLIWFGGTFGALPLALFLWPGLQHAQVLGLPLPLLLVGVPLYPFFVAVAFVYGRRADGLDEAFRDLVRPPDPED
jgi:putative solute:sodium symporter small subunit